MSTLFALYCIALHRFALLRTLSWLSLGCRVKSGKCIGEDGKGVRLNVKGDGEDACVRAVPVRFVLCLAFLPVTPHRIA
jgi:hypothetical protein